MAYVVFTLKAEGLPRRRHLGLCWHGGSKTALSAEWRWLAADGSEHSLVYGLLAIVCELTAGAFVKRLCLINWAHRWQS
jgi:hypothetical protein